MADAAEGPDAAGLSDTFGYIFVLGNTFFVLVVCWRKIISNFLKFAFFCKILQKMSGVPDAAGLSDTFLVLEILVEKKLSQIFSNFLGIPFLCIGNGGKLSQIFSKVFQFFQFFLKKCLYWSQVECSGGRVHIGGVCRDTCLVFVVLKYISELCVVGLIRKCPCCGECFVLSSQEMIASDKHYQQFQVINTISIDTHHVRKHCEKTL